MATVQNRTPDKLVLADGQVLGPLEVRDGIDADANQSLIPGQLLVIDPGGQVPVEPARYVPVVVAAGGADGEVLVRDASSPTGFGSGAASGGGVSLADVLARRKAIVAEYEGHVVAVTARNPDSKRPTAGTVDFRDGTFGQLTVTTVSSLELSKGVPDAWFIDVANGPSTTRFIQQVIPRDEATGEWTSRPPITTQNL